MNKKVQKLIVAFFGTILLSIVVTVALAPVLASGNKKNESVVTFTGSGGNVNVPLPPGEPSHPTDLQFAVFNFDKRSTFGSFDVMLVAIWIPSRNGYASVAVISNSPDPEFFDHAHTVLSGTPMWNPAAELLNIFELSGTEFEVHKRGNVLTAELTVPLDLALNFSKVTGPLKVLGDLSFTLAPIKIEIRGFDSTFREEESSNLQPSPPLSGYTITQNTINKPAWVRVWITPWLGPNPQCAAGTMFVHVTRTYTPPST